MKKIIFLLYLFLSVTNAYSQISNGYFKVIGANPCGNELELESTTSLEKGDKIVIIQMNGAIIDRTNTKNYGNIIDFNGAGQFEFNEVIEKNGNKAKFKFKIKEGYDFNAAVQVIKVENNKNLTVNSNPFVREWNGSTGGVLVLYAEETITLASDIDVSGKGFRGAEKYQIYDWSMLEKEYYYPKNTLKAANKGEGIAIYDPNYAAGKGKNANGGGGGNAADGGGGGGGNLSFGGQGGFATTYYLIQRNGLETGLGGGLSNYNENPLIMGGGSGAGAMNHNLTYDGVSGGGIVIIKCKSINSISSKIISNGNTENRFTGTEGAPGGGGAGTIFIDAEDVFGGIQIIAIGGKGGDVDGHGLDGVIQNECMGPGGGGGGGTLYLNKNFTNINDNLSGGKSGVVKSRRSDCFGLPYGSTDGEVGKKIIPDNFQITLDEFIPNIQNEIISEDVDSDCGIIAKWLESKLTVDRYYWYFNNESSIFSTDKRIYVSQSGKYKLISQRIDECKKIIFDTLEIDVNINSGSGEQKLQITTNKVYFENSNQTIINTKEFGVKNISKEDYLLEKVYFAKNTHFSLPKSTLPILIKPNETRFLKVVFLSNIVDNFKDTITILDNCKDLEIELETDNGELYLDGKNKCDLEWSIGEKNDTDSLNFIVQILPNISSDNVYIISNQKINEIQILNSIGELIQKVLLQSETNEFNLNVKNYENGLYYLLIKSVNNNHIFSKFMKIE